MVAPSRRNLPIEIRSINRYSQTGCWPIVSTSLPVQLVVEKLLVPGSNLPRTQVYLIAPDSCYVSALWKYRFGQDSSESKCCAKARTIIPYNEISSCTSHPINTTHPGLSSCSKLPIVANIAFQDVRGSILALTSSSFPGPQNSAPRCYQKTPNIINTTCELCTPLQCSRPQSIESKVVGTTATNTTAKPQINSKGIEFFPVHGENVDSYDAIFYNDRICIVVYRGVYEHKYSGRTPKHHLILSTLREGRILETVMQPSEILMRITANGMAMMPEHFPQEPVLAGQAKKGMVIMIRDRPCQIRDVTLNKVGEATVVHIQASALRNYR